jgi:hypothetical protein
MPPAAAVCSETVTTEGVWESNITIASVGSYPFCVFSVVRNGSAARITFSQSSLDGQTEESAVYAFGDNGFLSHP